MNYRNLLSRFNEYQKERFPFAVLTFTTLSVVLSSAAVAVTTDIPLSSLKIQIIIGTLTCLLFMFNIRVFDDFKDKSFDNQFHKKRPVQRGLISLKELNIINLISIAIQVILNLFMSINAFIYWILAMCYSLIAKKEFFIKKYIRKTFILYNFLNLMQMFFLQIYLYALIEPNFSFKDPLLFIHFIFVLSNAVILEVARKMKSKREESKGMDTYSGRYGVKKSAFIYSGSYLVTYLLFYIIFISGKILIFDTVIKFNLLSIYHLFNSLLCVKTIKIKH
jgi:4-hydroxybenzoate polyprenyltransferase